MACMEHECVDCGWYAADNKGLGPNKCPTCGGNVSHRFDEEGDDEDRDEEEPI